MKEKDDGIPLIVAFVCRGGIGKASLESVCENAEIS
jgi:hypothetical protein